MPSWLIASIRVACSIAHSAVFALRLPCSASGSICDRRAEMTANSAPTKKALAASSTNSQTMPAQSLIVPPPRSRPPRARASASAEAQPVDAAAVEALHDERALVDGAPRRRRREAGRARPSRIRRRSRSRRSRARGCRCARAVRRVAVCRGSSGCRRERTMPARVRSCSSATSPTSSSTRSSSVATPAVPPYSSTTTAIWNPRPRSSPSSASSLMVSGTRSASDCRAEAGTSDRRSRGTATACLTCTMPTMSSRFSS